MKIHLPNGFEFQGLHCYPNPEQDSFYYYLPSNIQPQRDSKGKPLLTLVTVGSGGYLQFSTLWDVPLETVEALRQEIARRAFINPATVRLAFAPVTVQDVLLLMGDGSGKWTELHKTRSSGFPPYSALFNVQLNAEQQTQVAAALNNREGFIQIKYDASLQTLVGINGRLSGDATEAIAKLKDKQVSEPTADISIEAKKYLQESILQGDLQLTIDTDDRTTDEISNSLMERVRTKILSQAADLLSRFIQGEVQIPDITHLEVTASVTEPLAIALPLQTDVATWFKNGTGIDQIKPAPGITPKPLPNAKPMDGDRPGSTAPLPTGKLKVYLNFSAADAPVALVRVRCGTAQAMLTPPQFAAVELPADEADGEICVETSYTTGGSPYQSHLPISTESDLALNPEHVGIVQVTVDAHPLETAGAKKARIHLRYQPNDQDVADEQTFYFRGSEWEASWFLVNRGESITEALEYEWQVTTDNEDLIKYERVKAAAPHIVLDLEAPEK